LFSGSVENVKRYRKNKHFAFVHGDIRDLGVVKRSVAGADCVFHLAAIISIPFSMKEPFLTHEVNSTGTLNVLQASLDAGVKRFVFPSSAGVYGAPKYLPIDEKHPTSPISPYAASKLGAEHYCKVFHEAYGLETVVLRLFNVYGSCQGLHGEGGVIVRFMEHLRGRSPLKIDGDGLQTRDFVHVSDVVDGFLSASVQKDVAGEIFNIGCGTSVTIGTLAETMLDLANSDIGIAKGEPRLGDIKHSYANIERAKKMLGYTPKMTLREGLQALLSENVESLIAQVSAENFITPR
jgi:UDP-glucose 4-epimerase